MKSSATIKVVLSAVLLLIAVAVWWKLQPSNSQVLNERTKETKIAIQQLASSVEGLRSKTGIVPTNESQLAALLAKPLPRSGWNTPLKYVVTNGGFRIETVSPYPHWMIFEYDSRNPAAGVAAYSF
jgi:hypothetical protein